MRTGFGRGTRCRLQDPKAIEGYSLKTLIRREDKFFSFHKEYLIRKQGQKSGLELTSLTGGN